jgi:hypothetical protein
VQALFEQVSNTTADAAAKPAISLSVGAEFKAAVQ